MPDDCVRKKVGEKKEREKILTLAFLENKRLAE
jgi:hypothetical protein